MHRNIRIGLVVGLTTGYALLRYVVFHDVPLANVPLYILNKAISWSGVILFGMSLLATGKNDRRHYGTLAFAAIIAHLVMSLMVLNPHYFAKFYGENGRMNAMGEWSMLFGVCGLLFLGGLFFINIAGKSGTGSSLKAGWGRLVLWFAVLHVGVMGFAAWLTPGTWPGYLPPITLASCVTALYYLYVRGRRPSGH